MSLNEVLAHREKAGATISAFKTAFVCEGLKIVAFASDSEGSHPVAEKVRKIVAWLAGRNVTEATAFIRICVYYCSLIEDCLVVAEPIFRCFCHCHVISKIPPENSRQRKQVKFN